MFWLYHCPEVCPRRFILDRNDCILADKGKDLQIVFVTVDPERDSIPQLQSYIGRLMRMPLACEDPAIHKEVEKPSCFCPETPLMTGITPWTIPQQFISMPLMVV